MAATTKRFWTKIDKDGPNGCWIWNGSRNEKGYGLMGTIGNKNYRAHRFSWELVHGPIPKGGDYHGNCILHRCDNPPCVNPAHLFMGTNLDNRRDAWAKDRHVRGERSMHARLKEADVLKLRKAFKPASGPRARDSNLYELARLYPHIAPTTIYAAATGRTWKYLNRQS